MTAKSGDDLNLKHEEYDEWCEEWEKVRHVIEGEREIVSHGSAYLPKLEGQSQEEYKAYQGRAKFINYTGRAHQGFHGMVFRKNPIIELKAKGLTEETAQQLTDDITLGGVSLDSYSRMVVSEVLTTGRGGTLVDYRDKERRSVFAYYRAESIWNWRIERINDRMELTMLLLHEESNQPATSKSTELPQELAAIQTASVERLRLYRLEEGAVVVSVFLKVEQDGKVKWVTDGEDIIPKKLGNPLSFIPFFIHGVEDFYLCCSKPPLIDVATVNLHHYRISADYNHALHFTALPTPYITGYKQKKDDKGGMISPSLNIGSTTAWLLENENAKVGFLEFEGGGLSALVEAMQEDKADMAILGARILEQQKKQSETAEAMQIRQGGDSSILATIANTTSKSLTEAIQTAIWWMIPGDASARDLKETAIKLNTEFTPKMMSPEELRVLLDTWIRGALSRETLIYNLQRADILQPGSTVNDELERLADDAATLGRPDDGRDKDKET